MCAMFKSWFLEVWKCGNRFNSILGKKSFYFEIEFRGLLKRVRDSEITTHIMWTLDDRWVNEDGTFAFVGVKKGAEWHEEMEKHCEQMTRPRCMFKILGFGTEWVIYRENEYLITKFPRYETTSSINFFNIAL